MLLETFKDSSTENKEKR